jgi:hypothetical protein
VLIFSVAGAVQHVVEPTCLSSATVSATCLIYGNITASKYKYAAPMVSPLHGRSTLTMRAWQEKAASLNQRPRWCLRCRLQCACVHGHVSTKLRRICFRSVLLVGFVGLTSSEAYVRAIAAGSRNSRHRNVTTKLCFRTAGAELLLISQRPITLRGT